jgi:hypothetical protein
MSASYGSQIEARTFGPFTNKRKTNLSGGAVNLHVVLVHINNLGLSSYRKRLFASYCIPIHPLPIVHSLTIMVSSDMGCRIIIPNRQFHLRR